MKIKEFFRKINQELSKKREINYLYFSILLLSILSLTLANFFFLKPPQVTFFILHALIQALIEVGGFLLFVILLRRWAPRWIHHIGVSITFIFLLIHFTDFTMIRLLDASISYLFKFFFGSGLEHVLTAFQALNMNWTMIAVSAAAVILIPFIGLALYWITYFLARRNPFFLSLKQIVVACISLSFFLVVFEISVPAPLTRLAHAKYEKGLPFGMTLISPPQKRITLSCPIAPPEDEATTLNLLGSLSISPKPNLYFFVIETLRKDFVNEETAPHLTTFGKQNIQFTHSFANANSTYLSWFSLFHSDFPFHWTRVRDQSKGGSIPLQILKQAGYKIHVYSSADLRYFRMDEILFGKDRNLADHIEEYSFFRSMAPCDRDALALQSFTRDLSKPEGKEGNVYLFFFDSTHSEYSFPDSFEPKFLPISKQIDYLTVTKDDIGPIQNRYRNSIAYIDALMEEFFTQLKQENLYNEAIIAITGDHGEEFFEEGALFHGTHLNQIQTSVPIFLKFQNNSWEIKTDTATHIDLFPSILHYLSPTTQWNRFFKGQSIFMQTLYPYRVTVLQNGPETPLEFTIENQSAYLRARFPDPKHLYTQTELEILALKSNQISNIPTESLTKIEELFPGIFIPLLKKSSDN